MQYLYEATQTPPHEPINQSLTNYPKGKGFDYVGKFGYFIQGKPYICNPLPFEPGRIKVAGFFKVVTIKQSFISKGNVSGRAMLKDYEVMGNKMAYTVLTFDQSVCSKFLKFIKKIK